MAAPRVLLLVVLILAVLGMSAAEQGLFKDSEYASMFTKFVAKFKKSAGVLTTSLTKRLAIFRKNVDAITKINSAKGSWKAGVNQFADMDPADFKKIYGNAQKPSAASLLEAGVENAPVQEDYSNLPKAHDWWTHEALQGVEVLNQGQCGSCWAHSAVSTHQLGLRIASHKAGQFVAVPKLSPQYLLDSFQGYNCIRGGAALNGLKRIQTYGIPTEAAYPYTAKQNPTVNQEIPRGYPLTYIRRPTPTNDGLAFALSRSVVSVVIDATPLQYYQSGIIDYCKPTASPYNHVVVATGFDDKAWKVLNSWGAHWGEKGFFRLGKFSNGTSACGILDTQYYTEYSLADIAKAKN